ncbi:DUF2793 domain-containing protein [Sphingomonas floccifaciens]|uniref:DUF2793 domain-containing protein n=1 Tax=Sphingomonas floccifaciens TaxID=1844115 RepID=A0ABW4NDE0_9SPHN
MNETTPRLGMPLLAPGQAQKDLTHNEALALIDLMTQPTVVAIGRSDPPGAPSLGDCWVVGAAATGAWAGRENAIAGWTAGGWRFCAPRDGFVVHVAATGQRAMFLSGAWRNDLAPAAITDPSGGNVIDVQARTAIDQLLAALRGLHLIPQ